MKNIYKLITILLLHVFLVQFPLFAENYNIETTTIEEDRIEAEARPEIANQMADKWYNKGNKELAIVFDTIYFQYDLENDLEDSEDITEKWYDRGEKEISLKFDRLALESDPFMTSIIANQWYERGEKEIALEFNKVEIASDPLMANYIADQWYERGEKEIALEFDKDYVKYAKQKNYDVSKIAEKWYERGEIKISLELDKDYIRNALQKNYDISAIAKKWYERGEKEISLEFDKDYVRYALEKNYGISEIAKKWYERGEKEISLEFDRLSIESYPWLATNIADQWYERGEKEIALEFDEIYLRHASQKNYDIREFGEKLYERADKDVLARFGKSYPNLALITLNKLIKSGNFADAEEYGNKMLEYWVSQNDKDIQENIDYKLKFAIKISSTYYYELLKNKLTYIDPNNMFYNYSKYLENIPLNRELKGESITDFLAHHSYVNPDFLSDYNLSIDEARKMLELDLYEISKKSDITFSVLHVIALFAKQNPYYKLNVFSKHPLGELPMSEGRRADGQCFSDFDMIMLCHRPLRNRNFRASLTHEWTHELMNIILKNVYLPYAADDEDAKKEWDEVMKKVWKQFDNAPQIYKSNFVFDPYLNPYREALSL